MTHDITEYDENTRNENTRNENSLGEEDSAPPLCLVHYFAERTGHPPERNPKPPDRSTGRVIERRGNLIILEFAPPPAPIRKERQSRGYNAGLSRVSDALMLLLLLACLLGCLAAFRF